MDIKPPEDSSQVVGAEIGERRLKLVASEHNEEQLLNALVEAVTKINKTGTKVISLVGGPGSGKTTLASSLKEHLTGSEVISTDDYVRGTRAFRRNEIERAGLDPLFEYDFGFMKDQVKSIVGLPEGATVKIPQYNYQTGIALSADPDETPNQEKYQRQVGRLNFLIVEGDFQPLERADIDTLIYFDVPDNVRLQNRVGRAVNQRAETTAQDVIDNLNFRQKNQTKPHTLPNRAIADWVIKVNATPLESDSLGRRFQYSYDLLQAVAA